MEEKVNAAKVNRGVKHLPNLEFKFVCANSLIGLPKLHSAKQKETQVTMFEAVDEIGKLKDLREEYLQSYGKRKKDIEKEFQSVQQRMLERSIKWLAHDSQTLQLSMWEPFSDKACSWFDPEWMFGVKDGFDIVIANPPYQEISNKTEKVCYQKLYREVLSGHYDLYIFFFRKAFSLTCDRGVISFITSHTYTVYPQFINLRKWIYENSSIVEITNRVEGIFE